MRTKYGNVPTCYAGRRYDSRGEAEYARHLDCLKAAGAIRDWRRGRAWVLLPGARGDRITYTPDFEVWEATGALYVLDFKGVQTEAFSLKARLWKAVYPDVPLLIVGADGEARRVA